MRSRENGLAARARFEMLNRMSARISDAGKPAVPRGRTRRVECAILGAVCALVIGVYVGSAHSGISESLGSKAGDSYYNLLVQGFRAGQLNLKTEVPPDLAKLADSYDPIAHVRYWWFNGKPLLDLSYY